MKTECSQALKVLVVEDEVNLRRLLHWELSHRGMRVEVAENGARGVQMAKIQSFDAIVTDVTMPEMDGLQLLEEIKRLAPETGVILVTGFGAIETAVYALQMGAFDFLIKPYDLDHLEARLVEAVKQAAACRLCGRKAHG